MNIWKTIFVPSLSWLTAFGILCSFSQTIVFASSLLPEQSNGQQASTLIAAASNHHRVTCCCCPGATEKRDCCCLRAPTDYPPTSTFYSMADGTSSGNAQACPCCARSDSASHEGNESRTVVRTLPIRCICDLWQSGGARKSVSLFQITNNQSASVGLLTSLVEQCSRFNC